MLIIKKKTSASIRAEEKFKRTHPNPRSGNPQQPTLTKPPLTTLSFHSSQNTLIRVSVASNSNPDAKLYVGAWLAKASSDVEVTHAYGTLTGVRNKQPHLIYVYTREEVRAYCVYKGLPHEVDGVLVRPQIPIITD